MILSAQIHVGKIVKILGHIGMIDNCLGIAVIAIENLGISQINVIKLYFVLFASDKPAFS